MDIDIDKLTLGQVRELKALFGGRCRSTVKAEEYEFTPGEAVFVATVTRYYIGRVKKIGKNFITLTESGWCAQTGEFTDFLEKGTPRRFQPSTTPWQMIGVGAIVEISPWRHATITKKVSV